MSWNGTVRCSHCYGTGHNKRGCPDRKKYAAENPDSWQAKAMKQDAERSKNRRCSYCAKKGHNRRGCVELKDRVRTDVAANKVYRNRFASEVERLGLGPGALIVQPGREDWNEPDTVFQVTALHWNSITIMAGSDRYADPRFLEVCPVADLLTRRRRRHVSFTTDIHSQFSKDIKDMENAYYTHNWRLVSRAPAAFQPPEGWADDETPIREHLKEAESPQAYENRHNE